jgi:hypothetical protein
VLHVRKFSRSKMPFQKILHILDAANAVRTTPRNAVQRSATQRSAVPILDAPVPAPCGRPACILCCAASCSGHCMRWPMRSPALADAQPGVGRRTARRWPMRCSALADALPGVCRVQIYETHSQSASRAELKPVCVYSFGRAAAHVSACGLHPCVFVSMRAGVFVCVCACL